MFQPSAPLMVADKTLIVTAHQSSPFPCSSNTLTLRFTPNFHVRSQSVISVSGLSDITTTGSTIDLADASGGYDHSELFRRPADNSESGATAVWINNILTLTVAAGHNLVAGQRYAVSFEVENPTVTRSGSAIVSNPAISYEQGADLTVNVVQPASVTWGQTTMSNVQVNADTSDMSLGLCGLSGSDALPLFIYKPTLNVHKIGQSSAYPCEEANVISVTLKSNMPLCADSCNARLTISNLKGAVLPDGPVQLMPIGTGSHALDHETFAAADKGEKGYALWSSSTETLTL